VAPLPFIEFASDRRGLAGCVAGPARCSRTTHLRRPLLPPDPHGTWGNPGGPPPQVPRGLASRQSS